MQQLQPVELELVQELVLPLAEQPELVLDSRWLEQHFLLCSAMQLVQPKYQDAVLDLRFQKVAVGTGVLLRQQLELE